MSTIAIDMMGSDNGPAALAEGIKRYLKEKPDTKVLLFGDKAELKPLFADVEKSRYEIEPTDTVIPMEIKPLEFLRARTSSMYQAILAVKEGKADGVLTAGSTGGFVTGATILLRNIEGVDRAALCTPFPTKKLNVPAVVLDVGANNYNTAEEVYQFALMGRIYHQAVFGSENPSLYLLSNGTEEGKGTEEVVGAYKLLKENKVPGFKGNVEARDALDGTHDILVTPGYAGNIFLKATEGMGKNMNDLIKEAFKHNFFTKIGYLFAHKGFAKMKETMNYRQYGGAILLGINGLAVKAHGNSDPLAFYCALKVVDRMIEKQVVKKVKEAFASASENHD